MYSLLFFSSPHRQIQPNVPNFLSFQTCLWTMGRSHDKGDRPIAMHLLTQGKRTTQTNKLGNVRRAKYFWDLRYVFVPLNHFVSVTRNYILHSLNYLVLSLLCEWDDVQISSLYRFILCFADGLANVDSHIPCTSRRVTHRRIFIHKTKRMQM